MKPMFALVTAASSSNNNTRVLPLVIWRKLKFVVAATLYPNASGPGAAAARTQPGHNRQTTSAAVDCPLLIVTTPKWRGPGCDPPFFISATYDCSRLRLHQASARIRRH